MANHASAEKRNRQRIKRTDRNRALSSSVRTLVVKSSTLVYGSSYRDPTWFREESTRVEPPKTRVERSLLTWPEAEWVREFGTDGGIP